MSVVVRTLSPQDADMLARTIVTGVVSNGRVERYDLRWNSDALRAWEVSQRALGKKPEVQIRIDELNLSVVYVTSLDGSNLTVRATSMLPKYTENLSLYEHRKLKEKLKELQIRDRMADMGDERAFNLRIEYYATLGRASDPVAYRRLVGLRDQLAALRAGGEGLTDTTYVSNEAKTAAPVTPVKPARGQPRKNERQEAPGPKPAIDSPLPSDTVPLPVTPHQSQTESPRPITRKFPHANIRRKPQ